MLTFLAFRKVCHCQENLRLAKA